MKPDGSGSDRSVADFFWAKMAAQRGWRAGELAAKLLDVSEKAQEPCGWGRWILRCYGKECRRRSRLWAGNAPDGELS
jgi:hypothetical protein